LWLSKQDVEIMVTSVKGDVPCAMKADDSGGKKEDIEPSYWKDEVVPALNRTSCLLAAMIQWTDKEVEQYLLAGSRERCSRLGTLLLAQSISVGPAPTSTGTTMQKAALTDNSSLQSDTKECDIAVLTSELNELRLSSTNKDT
jgi:hypothetical protein